MYLQAANAFAGRTHPPVTALRRQVCDIRSRHGMLLPHPVVSRFRRMRDNSHDESTASSVSTLDFAALAELRATPAKLAGALRPVLERQLAQWGITELSTAASSTDDRATDPDDDETEAVTTGDRPETASLFDLLLSRVCRDLLGGRTFIGSIDTWQKQAAVDADVFLNGRILLVTARFCSVPKRRAVVTDTSFQNLLGLVRGASAAGFVSDAERDELLLVVRAQVGDREALLDLFQHAKSRLVGFFSARFHLRPDPMSDLLQETYARLLQSIKHFDPSLSTFLASARRQAGYLAIDHFRKEAAARGKGSEGGVTGPAEDAFVSTSLLKQVFDPRMPLHFKLAFAFKVFFDFQPRHIVDLSEQRFDALIEKLRSDTPRTPAYGSWLRTLAALLEEHLDREPDLRTKTFEDCYPSDVKTAKARSAQISDWLYEVKRSTIAAATSSPPVSRTRGRLG